MRTQNLISLAWCVLSLLGCGPGVNIGEELSSLRLQFSSPPSLVRPNDCTAISVRVDNAYGQRITDATATINVVVSDPSVNHLYKSLAGCQTFDSEDETNTFYISTLSPVSQFFLRIDDTALTSFSLRATATSFGLGAAEQTLPVSFNSFNQARGFNNLAFVVTVDPYSGKAYVGGSFRTFSGSSASRLIRVNLDGSLDSSFTQTGSGLNGSVEAVVVQADGKVLAGGAFTSYNGTARPRVVRLNADGSLDTAFAATGTGLSSRVSAIALQSDGKILVGGTFNSYNGTATGGIARLNADGSLDTSFAPAGTGLGLVSAIAVQADGKVIVGGEFSSYNGTPWPYIARLNVDGSLDTTFAPSGTRLNAAVNSLAVQGDGKVVVGGNFTFYDVTPRPRIARLNSDGTLDTTFAPSGTGLDDRVYAVAVQPDGKVVVGGDFVSYNSTGRPYLARLNSDGSLDTSFVAQGTGHDDSVRAISLQADGKVVTGGIFLAYNGTPKPRFSRLNSDGSLDTLFSATGTGFNENSPTLALQADGKILAGGSFTSYNGTPRARLARLNIDGSLDTTFDSTGTGFNGTVIALAVQSDGRVLVGGAFTTYNSVSRPNIARLNSDGSLDNTFIHTGTGFNSFVRAIAVQSDGKVLVGGEFVTYNGVPRSHIARLNSDGSLDTSFVQTGSGFDSSVYSLALQADGKVLVGGAFSNYDLITQPFIARLNSDGSIDPSFATTGTGLDDAVYVIRPQSDGKVLVVGEFVSYDGSPPAYMARLNSEGSLDTAFNQTGAGFNGPVTSLAIRPNGKLLVGGDFTSYNSVQRNYLTGLNEDGSLDTAFGSAGAGLDARVSSLVLQSDGKLVVGGGFTSFDTTTIGYILRLTFRGSLD